MLYLLVMTQITLLMLARSWEKMLILETNLDAMDTTSTSTSASTSAASSHGATRSISTPMAPLEVSREMLTFRGCFLLYWKEERNIPMEHVRVSHFVIIVMVLYTGHQVASVDPNSWSGTVIYTQYICIQTHICIYVYTTDKLTTSPPPSLPLTIFLIADLDCSARRERSKSAIKNRRRGEGRLVHLLLIYIHRPPIWHIATCLPRVSQAWSHQNICHFGV